MIHRQLWHGDCRIIRNIKGSKSTKDCKEVLKAFNKLQDIDTTSTKESILESNTGLYQWNEKQIITQQQK